MKTMPEDLSKFVKSLFCLDFLFYFWYSVSEYFPLATFPTQFCQYTNITIMDKLDFFTENTEKDY